MKSVVDRDYYLIPINAKKFGMNGIRLNKMFSETYPEIDELEKEKDELLDNHIFDVNKLQGIQRSITDLYHRYDIPPYLIGMMKYSGLYELTTGAHIECYNKELLDIYYASYDEILKYYNNFHYDEKFASFYSDFITSDENSFKRLL